MPTIKSNNAKHTTTNRQRHFIAKTQSGVSRIKPYLHAVCVAHSRMGGTDGAKRRCGCSERFLLAYGRRGATHIAPWQVRYHSHAWSPTIQSASRSLAKAIGRQPTPNYLNKQANKAKSPGCSRA